MGERLSLTHSRALTHTHAHMHRQVVFASGYGDRSGHGASDMSEETLAVMQEVVEKALDALAYSLDAKSKGYKSAVLSALFLMNNYHYMVRGREWGRVGEGKRGLGDSELWFHIADGYKLS